MTGYDGKARIALEHSMVFKGYRKPWLGTEAAVLSTASNLCYTSERFG